jgi:hypothetical protein
MNQADSHRIIRQAQGCRSTWTGTRLAHGAGDSGLVECRSAICWIVSHLDHSRIIPLDHSQTAPKLDGQAAPRWYDRDGYSQDVCGPVHVAI